MADLQQIANKAGYSLLCCWCRVHEVPVERLVRGAVTCQPACQNQKRKAYKRLLKELQLQRVIAQPKSRRLAAAYEASRNNSDSATVQVQDVV